MNSIHEHESASIKSNIKSKYVWTRWISTVTCFQWKNGKQMANDCVVKIYKFAFISCHYKSAARTYLSVDISQSPFHSLAAMQVNLIWNHCARFALLFSHSVSLFPSNWNGMCVSECLCDFKNASLNSLQMMNSTFNRFIIVVIKLVFVMQLDQLHTDAAYCTRTVRVIEMIYYFASDQFWSEMDALVLSNSYGAHRLPIFFSRYNCNNW